VSKRSGIWSLIASPEVVDVLVGRGEDFIVFDLEHGNWSLDDVGGPVLSCRRSGIMSVLRLPSPTTVGVQKACDLSPDVIQVSGLRAADDFMHLKNSFEPVPLGFRGFSPWSQGQLLFGLESVDQPILVPQIESIGFLENLEELSLAELAPVGGLFVGRYDLSQSFGKRGEISSSEVLDVLSRALELCQKASFSSWTVSPSLEDAEYMFSLGFDNVSISSDRQILLAG
jgi:4-hydroxy-2-oxoheptanedioate aldolase